jgi:nicotinate-nucleotide adenylyltransferase
MRIGIFGGTFDPVHFGHLIIAEQAREQVQLDEVLFIPSARPPHKAKDGITPFDRRAEMLQLALAGQTRLRVETMERDRPGPSFTADTLSELHRRQPADSFFLILGGDCLPDLPHWHEPVRIIQQATLVIAARPGWKHWSVEEMATVLHLQDSSQLKMLWLEIPQIDIASRDLRQRAAQGRSLLYMVPRAVEVFIREKRLYQPSPEAPKPDQG